MFMTCRKTVEETETWKLRAVLWLQVTLYIIEIICLLI
jgi:hypothetical protein